MTENLRRTSLFAEHEALGARLVSFAGWAMPVQYAGVIPEVKAVREACGVFDVSHMVQYQVAGDGATAALNRVVSAEWSTVPVHGAAYGLLLSAEGGVLDDLMGYRTPSGWTVVGNASRYTQDAATLKLGLGPFYQGDKLYDGVVGNAMLAIQGPQAPHILAALMDSDPATLPWRSTRQVVLAGAPGLLVRGGYTGSDGYEFLFAAEHSVSVWRALLAAGVVPCGLGARDVLRLEAGLPLYGHELREEWTPAESGVGFAFKPQKGDFVGRDAAGRPAQRKIVALRMVGRAVPREGYPVVLGGSVVGEVTSGTMSPTVGAGIALASVYLEGAPVVGDQLEVQIRGTNHAAKVVKRPFVPFAER